MGDPPGKGMILIHIAITEVAQVRDGPYMTDCKGIRRATMPDHEKQSVIDRLKAYKKQFDDLLAVLDKLPLQRKDRAKAQQMLKALKDSLRNDYKAGATIRGQQRMTQAERQYFHPAVQETYADIHVRWNTLPNEQWRSELYGAQINISHTLHQLES